MNKLFFRLIVFVLFLFISSEINVSCAQSDNTAIFIENVLLQDALTSYMVHPNDPEGRKKIIQAMSSIDLTNTPEEFQIAYKHHIDAWIQNGDEDIRNTFAVLKMLAQQHGAKLPPSDLVLLSQELFKSGSDECVYTGTGPGNSAACGGRATECIYTGTGPGNSAACGGLATDCIYTGTGPGNSAACGGLATECIYTGTGPGNSAACGGLATECIYTGTGPGNSAACGGLATECIYTGTGPGNSAACGGDNG